MKIDSVHCSKQWKPKSFSTKLRNKLPVKKNYSNVYFYFKLLRSEYIIYNQYLLEVIGLWSKVTAIAKNIIIAILD